MREFKISRREEKRLRKIGYLSIWGANTTCAPSTIVRLEEKFSSGLLDRMLELTSVPSRKRLSKVYPDALPEFHTSLMLALSSDSLKRSLRRDGNALSVPPKEWVRVCFDPEEAERLFCTPYPDILCSFAIFSVTYYPTKALFASAFNYFDKAISDLKPKGGKK